MPRTRVCVKVKSTTGQNITWLYHYPDPGNLKPSQENYIHRYIDTVEQLIVSSGFADPITGVFKYLSTTSFIDYFILTELDTQHWCLQGEQFFYRKNWMRTALEDNSKRVQALGITILDTAMRVFAQALRPTAGCTTGTPATLLTPTLWKRLLDDPNYANELKCRYRELRKTILDTGFFFNFIKNMLSTLWIFHRNGILTNGKSLGPTQVVLMRMLSILMLRKLTDQDLDHSQIGAGWIPICRTIWRCSGQA